MTVTLEIHPADIRGQISTLLAADLLASYASDGYVVTQKKREIQPGAKTAFVQFKRFERELKAFNELRHLYEFHIHLSVLNVDPDLAEAAMDLFLPRVVKSVNSHPTLSAYVIDNAEEVWNCFTSAGDITRGVLDNNAYLHVCLVKAIVQTSKKGA